MSGAALILQQALGEQRAEHAAGELGQHVDHAVERPDPPDRHRGEGHGRVEVTAADDAEHDDQSEQQEGVDEPDDSEIRAELSLTPGRHEQNDDAADEEDQQKRADQLSKICGKTSFLHSLLLDPVIR
jgi:hypothetical protein